VSHILAAPSKAELGKWLEALRVVCVMRVVPVDLVLFEY
jgi:hypothetical protein